MSQPDEEPKRCKGALERQGIVLLGGGDCTFLCTNGFSVAKGVPSLESSSLVRVFIALPFVANRFVSFGCHWVEGLSWAWLSERAHHINLTLIAFVCRAEAKKYHC